MGGSQPMSPGIGNPRVVTKPTWSPDGFWSFCRPMNRKTRPTAIRRTVGTNGANRPV
jgi:hypothetical protein